MAAADPIGLFTRSDAPARTLRVGLLVPRDGRSTALAAALLDDLRRANYLEIVARHEVEAPLSAPAAVLAAYLRRVDARYAVDEDPLAPRELALPALANDGDIDAWISLLPPDSCGRLSLPANLPAARSGSWYLALGDSRRFHGDGNGLRELVDALSLTAAELRCRGADGGTRVLGRVECASSPYPSLRLNRVAPLWNARHLLLQQLRELHARGMPSREGQAQAPRAALPGTWSLASWMARRALRQARARFAPAAPDTEHWKVAVRRAPRPLYENLTTQALREFRWLESPRGTFWADPFLFAHEGQTWLFYEEMDYALGRAHLSCGRLDEAGLRETRVVLRLPFHLSYPQVFAADGEVYLLPEASASGVLTLYRAQRFPDQWVPECQLLDFPCVDSTVLRARDRWWLFTSPMMVAGHAPVTWLFSAEALRGPWSFHASSPVASSAAVARGGGEIQAQGERLVRPSQDCAAGYGSALLFNTVEPLGADIYRETVGGRISGGWHPGLAGVHTYNRAGDWETIDGKFLVAGSTVR
jgi:hypothetical protein